MKINWKQVLLYVVKFVELFLDPLVTSRRSNGN